MSPRYSQILFDNEKLHWKSLSQKIRTDTSKQRSQTTGQRKSELAGSAPCIAIRCKE